MDTSGDLLRRLVIPDGAPEEQYSFERLFVQHAGNATSVRLDDPYMRSRFPVDNLRQFLSLLLDKTPVRDVFLNAHAGSRRMEHIIDIDCDDFEARGLKFSFDFSDSLHARQLEYSSGIAVVADRGLD